MSPDPFHSIIEDRVLKRRKVSFWLHLRSVPVWNHPSTTTPSVRSWRLWYPENKVVPLRQISPRGTLESASYPILGTDSSLASIVVMGTPTVPIIGYTLAMEVKHPPQLSVRPEVKITGKEAPVIIEKLRKGKSGEKLKFWYSNYYQMACLNTSRHLKSNRS